jgi:predicted O-methyltransferase YrrM
MYRALVAFSIQLLGREGSNSPRGASADTALVVHSSNAGVSDHGASMQIPRPHKHWTLGYLKARMRQMRWQKAHPLDPWLTRDAVAFLRNWLRPGDLMVEFGSGRSTIWFAKHVTPKGHIISVEHHAEWFREVTNRLNGAGLGNVSYLISEEKPEPYVGAADIALASRGGYADCILVDGRMRDHCAVWALDHVKPGGLIVVDNVQRYLPHASLSPTALAPHEDPASELWKEFAQRTRSWRTYWTSDDVEDTAFYFAPPR